MSDVTISIIVPSYRSAGTIRDCLTALTAQASPVPFEIIVVDSSDDATPRIIRNEFPSVRLIRRHQKTDPATGRNLGARAARGATLCFIDSDCVAAPDWAISLHRHLEAGANAVGGAIGNANGETSVSWAGYVCEFREFLPGGPVREAGNLTIGNSAYRREEFLDLGGFPVGYFPQEDQVFHAELRRRGMRIVLDPQIIVYHNHRTLRQEFLNHQRRIGQVNARVLQTENFSGAAFARTPWLARLAMPALVPYRFLRTVAASAGVEEGLVWRRPTILWLCWQGMVAWGQGFLDVSAPEEPRGPAERATPATA